MWQTVTQPRYTFIIVICFTQTSRLLFITDVLYHTPAKLTRFPLNSLPIIYNDNCYSGLKSNYFNTWHCSQLVGIQIVYCFQFSETCAKRCETRDQINVFASSRNSCRSKSVSDNLFNLRHSGSTIHTFCQKNFQHFCRA